MRSAPAAAIASVLIACGLAQAQAVLAPDTTPVTAALTFDEAVRLSLERNPTIGQAQQAIRRAQALLDQARAVFRPDVFGTAGTTVLDDPRGFDGNITQPRTQSTFNATASFAFLAPSRWAAKNQAADQVRVASISAEETRRQVALTAAQSYLAVIPRAGCRTSRCATTTPRRRWRNTRVSGSRPARAAASTTSARRRRLASPKARSKRRPWRSAGPRRLWASPSSPTDRWTRTGTRTSSWPDLRRRTMRG